MCEYIYTYVDIVCELASVSLIKHSFMREELIPFHHEEVYAGDSLNSEHFSGPLRSESEKIDVKRWNEI